MNVRFEEADPHSLRKLVHFYHSLNDSRYGSSEKVLGQLGDINYQFPASAFFETRKPELIGATALHLAQRCKQKQIFDSLLQDGTDFTIKDAKGATVLHQSVQHVLDNFKDNSWRHGLFQAKTDDEFVKAVLTAHVRSNNINNPSNNDGISHFHVACLANHSEAVKFFLDHGIPIDDAVDENSPVLSGYTPLHIAAICDCLETVEVLLNRRADTTARDAEGSTPLRSVVSRNMEIIDWMHTRDRTMFGFSEQKSGIDAKEEIINLLIRKNIDGGNKFDDDMGFSLLHAASTLKDTSVAQQLLEKKLNVNRFVKMDSPVWPGYTALHFAAHFNVEMVKFLLSKGGNVEAKDAHRVTPFDMCVQRFNVEDLHDILSSHAIWRDIVLSDGTTKLVDLVKDMSDPKELLESHNPDQLRARLFIPLDSPLWPGRTALHLAVMFTETVKIVDDCQSLSLVPDERPAKRRRLSNPVTASTIHTLRVQICLAESRDVTAKDARGSTPLHLAFRLQAYDVTKLMLECDPGKVNPVDMDNLSHLYVACYLADLSLVETLLSSGANANTPLSSSFRRPANESSFVDKYRSLSFTCAGSTPLHAAVVGGNTEVTSFLVNSGADVNARDANGLTPLHLIFLSKLDLEFADALLLYPELRNYAFNNSLKLLHLATVFGNIDTIVSFLDSGEDINAVIQATETYNRSSRQPLTIMLAYAGCTPLHIAAGLHSIERVHSHIKPEIVTRLLERGADMFIANSAGLRVAYSSLSRRYKDQRSEGAEIAFLEKNATLQRRMFEDSGITMLHVACWKIDVKTVTVLLDQGADVNAQARADSPVWPGWTPMHVLMMTATNYEADDTQVDVILQMLFDCGANVGLVNGELDTPLHLIEPENSPIDMLFYDYRSYANSPYTGLLLDKLIDDKVNPCNIDGISPFHIACLRNDVWLVKTFLQLSVDVNQPIGYFSKRYPGYTALHLAVNPETPIEAKARVATVKLLVERGADVRARDAFGNTPLHLAVKRGIASKTLLDSIISAGANLDSTNMIGLRAFDMLLTVENLKKQDIKYFLRRGCRLNSYMPDTGSFPGEGYLGILSAYPFVTEIISTWDGVLEIDETGRTAIHNIVSTQNFQAKKYSKRIAMLVSRGCDIDRQDDHGDTALHVAVKFLNLDAVSVLLKLGADVNLTDADEKTALARCLEYYDTSLNMTSFPDINYPCQMVKYFAMHVYKMKLCGLYVHELNIKTLTNIPGSCEVDKDDMKKCHKELKRAKNAKICSTQLPFYNFLTDIRAWESLPIERPLASDTMPCPVRKLFELINGKLVRKEFPEFVDILQLQYRHFRKAQVQPDL